MTWLIHWNGGFMENQNRNRVKVGLLSDPEKEGVEIATPAQGLEMMWQLTLDAWAFMKDTHAESRLQRHVGRLVRGKG